MVKVELVYITVDKNVIQRTLDLRSGATVLDALKLSGIYTMHPETRDMAVGILQSKFL